MKTKFKAGQMIAGIEVLAVQKLARHPSYASYLVRYGCGHEITISGTGLISRRRRFERGIKSTLCEKCTRVETNVARTGQRKRPAPTTQAEWALCFSLMNRALSSAKT